jgi:hypothetical protein
MGEYSYQEYAPHTPLSPYVSAVYCDVRCYGVTFQDGHLTGQVGCCGLGRAGVTVGGTSARAEQQTAGQLVSCAARVVGACLQGGERTGGDGDWYGGGVTFGTGVQAGVMGTVIDWDVSGGTLSIFGAQVIE